MGCTVLSVILVSHPNTHRCLLHPSPHTLFSCSDSTSAAVWFCILELLCGKQTCFHFCHFYTKGSLECKSMTPHQPTNPLTRIPISSLVPSNSWVAIGTRLNVWSIHMMMYTSCLLILVVAGCDLKDRGGHRTRDDVSKKKLHNV